MDMLKLDVSKIKAIIDQENVLNDDGRCMIKAFLSKAQLYRKNRKKEIYDSGLMRIK